MGVSNTWIIDYPCPKIRVIQYSFGFAWSVLNVGSFGIKKMIPFSTLSTRYKSPSLLLSCTHVWLKSTKSGPVGFEKIDFSHFSPCSMQWMFQTLGVSIVHVLKPCHTIIFSFRVVGPQSWVLRVTKLSRFLRYPQDTSHLLYFFMYKWILITYCSVWYNCRWASLMRNAIINIMLGVLICRFQHVHICKMQLSDGTLVCR